ncbi:MAG: hypothetical protein ACJKSS_00180 [Patescibacteria group bacterium UBA2103]
MRQKEGVQLMPKISKNIDTLFLTATGHSYFEVLQHTDPSGMRSTHIEDPDADVFDYELGEPNGTPIDHIF